jgi:hypothetical protein
MPPEQPNQSLNSSASCKKFHSLHDKTISSCAPQCKNPKNEKSNHLELVGSSIHLFDRIWVISVEDIAILCICESFFNLSFAFCAFESNFAFTIIHLLYFIIDLLIIHQAIFQTRLFRQNDQIKIWIVLRFLMTLLVQSPLVTMNSLAWLNGGAELDLMSQTLICYNWLQVIMVLGMPFVVFNRVSEDYANYKCKVAIALIYTISDRDFFLAGLKMWFQIFKSMFLYGRLGLAMKEIDFFGIADLFAGGTEGIRGWTFTDVVAAVSLISGEITDDNCSRLAKCSLLSLSEISPQEANPNWKS